MTQLVLHIGQTKTGTTSLQAFCAANRTWLADRGIHYPVPPAAHPLRNQHRFLIDTVCSRSFAFQDSEPTWQVLHQQIQQSKARLALISEEVFWHLDEMVPDMDRVIAWIGQQLARYEVQVVIYLRPQPSWIEAWFNQLVKTDVTRVSGLPFREFLEHYEQRGLFDYDRMLNRWATVFGHDALIVRTFEPTPGKAFDIVDDFFQALGVAGLEGAVRPPKQQPRLSQPACELTNLFNRHRRASEFKTQFKEALLDHEAGAGDRRQLLSPEQSAALRQRCSAANRRVAQRYLGRDDLFAEPVAHEETYGGLSVADLAQLMIQVYIDQQARIRQLRRRVEQLEAGTAAGPARGDQA